MAGYVKLFRSIWQDDDFKALDDAHQRLYLMLISQPDISHCGVLPLLPTRWATLAGNRTADDLMALLGRLVVDNFVAVDVATAEVWVRSYAIYDEAFKVPNGAKSLVAAYGKVLSNPLRTLIATLLATLKVTVPVREGSPHSQQPTTITVSQQVTGPVDETTTTDQRVADAIEYHAVTSSQGKDNPKAYAAKVRATAMDEHGSSLATFAAANPDATAAELVGMAILGITRKEAREAWYPDPHCQTCDGTGLRVVDDGGAGTGYPCDCRRPEPYLATVTNIKAAM